MTTGHLNTRWMQWADLDTVVDIERQSFPYPWTKNDFVSCQQNRENIFRVCVLAGRIVGYLIVEPQKTQSVLLNIAVDTKFRRQGIGTYLLGDLLDFISKTRIRIEANVSERNVTAQVFLHSYGFQFIRARPNYYDEPNHDAYKMDFRKTMLKSNRMNVQ